MGNVRHYLQAFYVSPGADCIQGAKAQQKRERKAQNATKATKSQSKSNEMAKNIICLVCKQSFLVTTRAPALEEHAQNRHSKTMVECFPNVSV
ncbi:At2g23090 like protein [Russula emetica]|nr:At2g23090 like protein [Russula emetica]